MTITIEPVVLPSGYVATTDAHPCEAWGATPAAAVARLMEAIATQETAA